jgi:ABC-type transport system involved in cytochrome bd biosynthesis fused ATPase/permease subunit
MSVVPGSPVSTFMNRNVARGAAESVRERDPRQPADSADRVQRRAGAPQPTVADSHDLIRAHGARVNHLKDVSIKIPKRRLTVITGVSGSGKSLLVFGTIAGESQMTGTGTGVG